MSLLQRVRDRFLNPDPARMATGQNLQVRSIPTVVPLWQQNKAIWPRYRAETYIDQGYNKVVVAYRCVNFLSNAVASAVLRAYDVDQSGQRVPIDPDKAGFGSASMLATLVRDPNPWMSQAELLAVWTKMAAVTGFGVLEKVRGETFGQVLGIWPLRSDWLKPIPREQAAPDWQWSVPGRSPQILEAKDVIPFTFEPSPTLDPIGTPPLQAALREVGIENAMTDWAKLFFQNNAIPSYLAIVKESAEDIDQDEADTMRAKMQERFGGSRGAGQIGVLPWLDRLERVGLNFDEMAYPELRDLTATQICSAFGVPPILVGVKAGLDASTYSNYKQARRAFYEDVVYTLWMRLDGAISRGLVSEFAVRPSVSLEFDRTDVPALQDDVTPTWQRATAALQAGGITRNDFRREVGLAPVAGGDVFLESIATVEVPAGSDEQRSRGAITVKVREVDPKRLPASGQRFTRLPPETRAKVATIARDQYGRLAEKGAPWLRRFWKEQGERIARVATRELGDGEWERRVGWFTAERRVPLSEEAAAAARLESRDLSAIDWGDEDDLLKEVLARLHVNAGKASFDVTKDLLSIDSIVWDINNPRIADVLGELGQRVTGINATTRADLQNLVGKALDEGVTMDELADRITGLFGETYQSRAMAIARTESQVAYNLGAREAYRASGVVSRVELADNPDHTEDYGASDGLTCAERNGIIVDLDSIQTHVEAEHPNGTVAVIPLLDAAGEE